MARKTGIRTMGAPPKPLFRRTPPRSKSTKPLTAPQRLFLETYLRCLNATQAYKTAYPRSSWAAAESSGSRLLKDARVGSEVAARIAVVVARYRPTSDNTLHELASMAFSNIRDTFDADGALIPIHQLPASVTAAIKKVKSKELTAVDPESGEKVVVGHLREVELVDKIRPLHLLGLHEGLFGQKVQLEAGTGFAEALRELRERAAKVG